MKHFFCIAALLLVSVHFLQAADVPVWQSKLVQLAPDGLLTYFPDETGNVIPNFSHAGYRGGGVPLPMDIPVVKTIAPIEGDNTAHIQQAIDAIAALPIQANGYRGALRFAPGIYEVTGTLRIAESGIVLSGAGMESDPASNTIIRRIGNSREPIILAGGTSGRGWRPFATEVPDTRTNITTERIPVGSYSFEVENATGFSVGDAILVIHPSTDEWLRSVNYGDAFPQNETRPVWRVGEIDLRYHRYIKAIDGNTITLDAPVYDNLDRRLSQSYIAKFDDTGITRNIGIEKMFVDLNVPERSSPAFARDCIVFRFTENCWVRHVHTQHFIHAGIFFSSGSTRSTIYDCRAVEPRGPAAGGNYYNFCVHSAQLILFEKCFASGARHAFISNGNSLDSGIVFLDCHSDRDLDTIEGHRRWPQALLFDNVRATNPASNTARNRAIGLYNRGNWGTAHGWAAVHSVAWNCVVDDNARIIVQRPPGAQNYAIGCMGIVTGVGPFRVPPGYIEGANRPGLEPRSLYRAQLEHRLSQQNAP